MSGLGLHSSETNHTFLWVPGTVKFQIDRFSKQVTLLFGCEELSVLLTDFRNKPCVSLGV